jgi:phosphoribosylglycinamide formyltransferase-1
MRIAVFASGNGSNFQAIAEAIASGGVDATIAFLFCDKPKAYAIERANQFNIPVISFTPKGFEDRVAYENEILKHLAEEKVDLVVLAGYMRIVGPTLLTAYADRIVNIHPSLLPDFPGRHGIQDAFEAGVPETGVTVHFVDEGVDTGPIIAQEKVAILPEDTLETLETRIHQVEHRIFPQVIQQLAQKNKG